MSKDLVATARTSIAADKRKVWTALINPEAIKQYMFGAAVESDWRVGSEIKWSGEFHGKKYKDRGKILQAEPQQVLSYSHFSSLSGKADDPANYHTVPIRLSSSGKTTNVTLSQDNNPDEKARAESEKNWNTMLDGLRKYVEGPSRQVP